MRKQPLDVVLFHFGGPTNAEEVEPFLYRLFMDPFIIRAPLGPLRHFLARRISHKRAPETNLQYRDIGYSPINRYTDAQALHLKHLLERHYGDDVLVHVVNRYTEPFAAQVVRKIRWGKAAVVGITLYPHMSHSTVASSFRDFDVAAKAHLGHFPVMRKIYTWWFVDAYIQLSWAQLQSSLVQAIKSPGKVAVLFSAHGLPMKYVERGDPYVNDVSCHFQTLQELARNWLHQIGGDTLVERVTWHLSFQSRVGPVEWMRPYTEDSIQKIGRDEAPTLVMVPISFVSDHIETLYEMDVTYKALAERSGCKGYLRVKPANGEPDLAQALLAILRTYGVPLSS